MKLNSCKRKYTQLAVKKLHSWAEREEESRGEEGSRMWASAPSDRFFHTIALQSLNTRIASVKSKRKQC